MERRTRAGVTSWAAGLAVLILGSAAVTAVEVLKLDEGGATLLRLHDTGAMELAGTDARPGLAITQLGGGSVLTLRNAVEDVLSVDPAGNLTLKGTLDGIDLGVHAAGANAHHTPPTTLPPSGAAGGDLTGSYPNPAVVNDSHTHGNGTIDDGITVNNGRLFAPAGGGNVGIGTTAPGQRLEVNGNVKLSGGSPTYRIQNVAAPLAVSDVATKAYVDAAGGGGGSSYTFQRPAFSQMWGGTQGFVLNTTGPGLLIGIRLKTTAQAVVTVRVDNQELYQVLTPGNRDGWLDLGGIHGTIGSLNVPFKSMVSVWVWNRGAGNQETQTWVVYAK